MLTVTRKLLELLSPRARMQLGILMGFLMVTAVIEAMGVASIMPFIALVISPEIIHSNEWLSRAYDVFGFNGDQAFLTFVGVVVLVLLLLTNASKAFGSWLMMRFQYRELYELRRRLLATYMARPYTFFLGRNSSELGSTILGESSGVIDLVLRPVIDMVAGSLVTISILVFLIIIDPVVAMSIVGLLGGAYVGLFFIVRNRLARIGGHQITASSQMYRSVWEAMAGIKDLMVLGREVTFLDKFMAAARTVSKNFAFSNLIGQIPRYALEVIAFGGILITILYLINQGKEAAQVIPVVGIYAFAGYRLLPTLHSLFGAFASLKTNSAKLHLIHFELLSGLTRPDLAEQQLRGKRATPAATFSRSLELRDLHFTYEGAMAPSLNGLDVIIRPGMSVGLVGPTGCGKSTTVDLILGLLSPTSGSIVLDGVEINDANRVGWQKIIGYVPQSIFISDESMTRNIAFGVPDDEIDMVAVRRAATTANLAEFIETSLPEGYDTSIGERGLRLSGGQRQRIGIARALYRNPPVLVMDEATSALDGVTEDAVMEAVHRLSKQKTIILIAHRLTTVRDCDVIYQLDRGKVVASGTYDELMQESRWFRSAAGGMD
ncbi:MAG: ABC transporter ATP-binding protein [Steroidobacteraceae bacterium]